VDPRRRVCILDGLPNWNEWQIEKFWRRHREHSTDLGNFILRGVKLQSKIRLRNLHRSTGMDNFRRWLSEELLLQCLLLGHKTRIVYRLDKRSV